jgi:uncharacterized protein (DUF849 family)
MPTSKRTSPVLVKACLNGSRHRRDHEAIPITSTDLAIDARRAVQAGAAALHVHPRRQDGSETLDPGDCGAAIRETRAACPGIPLGLSTGLWIEGDPARRLSCLAGWTLLPDFVSVNFSELGALELCEALIARGIAIEAGVWSVADAQSFVESGLADRCLRVLIEPREQDPGAALTTADAIDAVLDRHGIRLPRVLHGEGAPAWPVLEAALERGHDIRIGFEDTLVLPDGSRAQHNGDLVAAAVRLVRRDGHRPLPASPPA